MYTKTMLVFFLILLFEEKVKSTTTSKDTSLMNIYKEKILGMKTTSVNWSCDKECQIQKKIYNAMMEIQGTQTPVFTFSKYLLRRQSAGGRIALKWIKRSSFPAVSPRRKYPNKN